MSYSFTQLQVFYRAGPDTFVVKKMSHRGLRGHREKTKASQESGSPRDFGPALGIL
jgi:hypothetical protein